MLLCLGTCVGRMTVGKEAALIADANGMLIIVAGMGSNQVLMTGLIDLTIAGDVVVVAGEAETGLVAGDEPSDRERTVTTGRATVNDD